MAANTATRRCAMGNTDVVNLLLDNHADVHLGGSGSVLGWVLAAQNLELLKLLLNRGLDLNHRS